VRKFADEILAMNKPIHLLINNAGIMGVPFKETKDGFESQFQVNFLSHFLLTNLLLPKMIKTATECQETGRVVNVNAAAMYHARLDLADLQLRKRFNPFVAYFNSKLLQVLMTRHLDTKLQNAGVTNVRINSVHPGVVATELVAHMKGFNLIKWLMEATLMTPEQGADDVLYTAISPDTEKYGGEFFVHQRICTKANPYFTPRIQNKVWQDACDLVGCDPHPKFDTGDKLDSNANA
jgi:NAD(P)-dependent dehydrogenase (short-subunit alcohol dehydrogenase family)